MARVIGDIGTITPTLAATATLGATTLNNSGTTTLHVTAPADAGAGNAVIQITSQRTLLDYNVWFLEVASP
jgi:hypothetical protein